MSATLKSAEQILAQVPEFVESILEELKSLGVGVESLAIDHVCCRCANTQDYARLKREFLQHGTMISEALIGGRPIATFKLNESIRVGARQIPCLELPSPKAGKDYPTGLEHFEFVSPGDLTDWVGRYPSLKWETRGLAKAHNPELGLTLSNERGIKFHTQDLETVIRIEEGLPTT